MIFRICLLLSAVACYTSLALVYVERYKVGSRVRLYLFPREEIWVRERFGVAWEFIKRCGQNEDGPHCRTFVSKDIFFDDSFAFPSDSLLFKMSKFPSSRVHIFYDDDGKKKKKDDDCHFSTVIRFSSASEPGKNATVRKTSTTTKSIDGKKVVTKRTENEDEEVVEVLEDGELKSRTVNPTVAVAAAN
ncbi:unnamed protein product [Heligmosomoides polygyrus]|uniref:Uncharacterized protein n=1 Tax=Heligmosomoides polygyrus TaxID=6339 RepID=A0A3P7XK60_HELPZ|nr:unnamed protein product [Heligmosomoides polygyrus]